MKKTISLFALLLVLLTTRAQISLEYYLPSDVSYDSDTPTPKEVIGHEVGEWHVSHDKLVKYMEAIAASSDRIAISEHGRTYENRPLISLAITSPANHSKLEEIRTAHLKLSDPNNSGSLDIEQMPAVVYLGYSVHGNEPSGSNASLAVAYYLAAAQGSDIDKLLESTVIILDPSFNPDGLNRYASWVNSRKGMNLSVDPNDMEHNESWPGGRTNHYWFDLNRDWLPSQLPESQGRLANYHKWKPNILTDHHEMGTNSTYFFQPGIPSRNNPLTPDKNYQLTEKIAKYHAKHLDQIGSLYYARESFDDYYYGKGSTYPDINGSVGILFEQARPEGHAQESVNGVLTFPFAIRNHFTTSLSTLNAAVDLREELLTYQKEFYRTAQSEAGKDAQKGYQVSSKDIHRLNEFAKMLQRHEIDFYQSVSNSYAIPFQQPQYRLIKAMFEQRTTFRDSLFYDVSAWTLPLAFGLESSSISAKNWNTSNLGKKNELISTTPRALSQSSYAYLLDWTQYNSPRALSEIQKHKIITKVALEPFGINDLTFPRGTILIPVEMQSQNKEELFNILKNVQQDTQIKITPVATGYSLGVNIGSPQFKTIKPQKILLLVGNGVSGYDAGEVWHLLDTRVAMPLSAVTIDRFNTANINAYQTIIMVDGSYAKLKADKLKRWVQEGGNIVAFKRAAKWLKDKGINSATFKKRSADSTGVQLAYNDRGRVSGAQQIGGAIFQGRLDLTHPIAFGYDSEQLSTFRRGTLFMNKSKNPYVNPFVYTATPLQAGYISEENLADIKESAIVNVAHFGQGRVISFADNTNFRAFWYGTNRLFLNSLFFGQIIDKGRTR